MREVRRLFEDALLLAIEIVENSETKEEMLEKLTYVLERFGERTFYDRWEEIKRELGIWRKIP
jgi:hypothetical protein